LQLFVPPTPTYRFTAKVQQLGGELGDGVPNTPTIGVFLGHTLLPRDNEPPARGCVLLEFDDRDPERAAGRAPKKQPLRVDWLYLLGPRGGTPAPQRLQFHADTFDAGPYYPGKWWTITAESSPEELVVKWAREGEPEKVVRLSAKRRQEAFQMFKLQAQIVAQHARVPLNFGPLPNDWNPTGGIGIWAVRSRVAFKDVSVSKLP
jgi:hypothetical protein